MEVAMNPRDSEEWTFSSARAATPRCFLGPLRS